MKYRKLLNLLAVVSLAVGLFTGFLAPKTSQANSSIPARDLAVSETGYYIVRLEDASVSAYNGGIRGLAGTSTEATGTNRLDPNTPASQAYYNYLENQQQGLLNAMRNAFGHEIEVAYQYLYVLNAVAVRITHEEALRAFDLPGVKTVYTDTISYPDTDVGPQLIGADAVWSGNTYSELATQGEGIVIGVIDTGINPSHPSFDEVGPVDGYVHTNPYGKDVFHGWCETQSGFCNNKLIGAHKLVDDGVPPTDTPEDLNGHGSHTASTAGGNVLNAYFDVNGLPFSRTISGVAPHANIVAYKVCLAGCYGYATIAAVDLAVGPDMVDVINYSIGPGGNPWLDPVELAFLEATDDGIFVSVSGGNSGPGAYSIEHHAPWTSVVAASTHSRIYQNLVDVTALGGTRTGIPSWVASGINISSDFTAPIKYDAAYHDACSVIPAGTFTGAIALIQRGGCFFDDKITNVYNAGAVGMIVFNTDDGPPVTMGFTIAYIPSVMIGLYEGLELAALIAGDATATATIHPDTTLVIDPDYEDIMAGFSSRGPTMFDLLKPDYTAPGVNILAAVAAEAGEPEQYDFYRGTSMSSPHSAGAAALLMSLYEENELSPVEIRSAMATTADPGSVLDSDGVNPADVFDMGSGRLDLNWAASAGLVMDESYANFMAASPLTGGQPKDLNLPYLVNYDCIYTCTWTRSFTSIYKEITTWEIILPSDVTLTVDDDDLEFELTQGNPDITLTFTADVTSLPLDTLIVTEVLLVPEVGIPTRLPVVIVASAPPPVIDIDPLTLASNQFADELVDQTLTISNLGVRDLAWELYDDSLQSSTLKADLWSDNFDAYPLGSIQGLGGWKGWFNDPVAAGIVTADMFLSEGQSQAIYGMADSVHEYEGYTSGRWSYTAMQYIPEDFTGESMFILLNSYDDAGSNMNWSTQVAFNGDSGFVYNQGWTEGYLPLITGEWVEIRVDINLDTDVQKFYYGGQLLYAGTWTEENSGGGALNIGAVDLFANGASVVYYDDMSITVDIPEVCEVPGDIPWLSVDPASGVTAEGASTLVTATFDSTGLITGTYTGTLCAASNDKVNPLVEIPVTLTVVESNVLFLPLTLRAPTLP